MQHFLDKASAMYYSGTPILSDEEFDALAKMYNYDRVGYQVTDGIPHMFKMYSLQKVFDLNDIDSTSAKYIRTPKLDGAAISLVYINGHLAQALTRGDGNLGRDITLKMEEIVPVIIDLKETVQITGEVVAPETIPNARNYASGSLNLKDIQEFRSRAQNLRFVAYDIQGKEYATLSKPSFVRSFVPWMRIVVVAFRSGTRRVLADEGSLNDGFDGRRPRRRRRMEPRA